MIPYRIRILTQNYAVDREALTRVTSMAAIDKEQVATVVVVVGGSTSDDDA